MSKPAILLSALAIALLGAAVILVPEAIDRQKSLLHRPIPVPAPKRFIRFIHSSAIVDPNTWSSEKIATLKDAARIYVQENPGSVLVDADSQYGGGYFFVLYYDPKDEVTGQVRLIYRQLELQSQTK